MKQGELVWKKISISDVQTCTRVDDVHINIDFKSEQRTYKLRFPTDEDCDFFLKILRYVQDELSTVQEQRSRERSTTLERQASSLRHVSNPQVVSSRLDNDISARSVRMEFIAKDLSFTGETCECVCVCVNNNNSNFTQQHLKHKVRFDFVLRSQDLSHSV